VRTCVEGVRTATKRQCKFVEISALLDHRVDDLLVGIVRQIRLRQTTHDDDHPVTVTPPVLSGGGGGRLAAALDGALRRIVDGATTCRRRRTDVASLADCNNLFTA